MHPQFYEASVTILLATCLAVHSLAFGHPGHSRRLFLALIGSIVLWSGGVALSRVGFDRDLSVAAVHLSFLGIFSLPPIWYRLALFLTQRENRSPAVRTLVLLATPSLFALTAMTTNSWHFLFMRDPTGILDTSPQHWAGPLFWVWVGWAYLLVAAGSLRYVGWSWRLVVNDARLRGALVCLASLLPLGGNIFHLVGVTPPDHDLTPMLLGVATVMLFVANRRFQWLDTLPVARRDVIEQLRDGVIVTDARGMILDMNPAGEEMVGAPLVELIGQPIVRVVANRAVDRFDFDESAFNETVVSMCTSASGFEAHVENYDNRHFEIRGAGVTEAGGQVAGLYIIMRDVTERSRLEEVERESRRAQTIASLAAGITHEVNNPLSYVRANLNHVIEALDESTGKPEESADELRAVLEEALEGAERIRAIVERVRRFTFTRGGAREAISIEEIFEEAVRIRPPAQESPIEISISAESDIRPAFGYHDGLLEAILNLLENAQHALRETGGTIQLRARQVDAVVRIEVEDDGPGVPDEFGKQIFEPFFTTAHSEIGPGLGLSITGKLIADFGGTLSYEAVSTGGARFVIELPDAPATPGAPEAN